MQEEIWKDIEGFEGYYQVSNLGRVKSLDRYVPDKRRGKVHISERIMKLTVIGTGYYQVTLTKFGEQIPYYVHRLVAKAFISNPNNLPEVDHIDAVKTNNDVSNLRWVTQEENNQHIFEMGHHYDGTSNFYDSVTKIHLSSLTRRKAVVRSDGKYYESITAAALDLCVVNSSIRRVLTDKTHRAR